ncbi:NAD-dependent DNA ligase LigA, partial [bacterium]|nr:NAD-dependent DNA ligase LigA [bacterium]
KSKRKKENHPRLAEFQIDDSLGPVAAQSLLTFFLSEAGQTVLTKLTNLGIDPVSDNFAPRPQTEASEEFPFVGKTFVLTGSLSTPRSEFKKLIEAKGGKVSGSISAKTDYLLAGDGGGSKRTKAESLKVEIIDEEAFRKLIG